MQAQLREVLVHSNKMIMKLLSWIELIVVFTNLGSDFQKEA